MKTLALLLLLLAIHVGLVCSVAWAAQSSGWTNGETYLACLAYAELAAIGSYVRRIR